MNPERISSMAAAKIIKVVGHGARRYSSALRRRLALETPPRSQIYSIGMYGGPSPTALAPLGDVSNPVLTREHVTDVRASFVADPFMIRVEDLWYMFFEVLNGPASRGEIGLATSRDGRTWQYRQIVLREPFHLSYPYVFSWQGQYYMVPEMSTQQQIWLYRAITFPVEWERVAVLLSGRAWVDASLLCFDDQWWLFCSEGTPPARAETLRLFHSDGLEGPWREHARSPLVANDARLGRPAGRVIVTDGSVVRFTQDCAEAYGRAVRSVSVPTLTRDGYLEDTPNADPVLQGTGSGWNADGMHHVDPHPQPDGTWIACVDGWHWSW